MGHLRDVSAPPDAEPTTAELLAAWQKANRTGGLLIDQPAVARLVEHRKMERARGTYVH